MKADKLIEAFEFLDEKYIDEASPEKAKPFRTLKKRLILRRLTLAACICLITAIMLGVTLPMLRSDGGIPIYDDAQFTADEIAAFFGEKNDGTATSSYTKVYYPSAEYLNLSEIPTDGYITVYKNQSTEKPLSDDELREFTDDVLSRFASEVKRSVPEYSIEKEAWSEYEYLRTDILDSDNMDGYYFSSMQTSDRNSISLSAWGYDASLRLGGVYIEVDQRMTDEEIAASIGVVKDNVLSVFGVSYPDTKIVREYDSCSDKGCVWLTVYFYDESAHPINSLSDAPVSDYVSISFDNRQNHAGDIVSDGVLDQVNLSYTSFRADADVILKAEKRVRMLTPAEAEELLYRGYVFGNHVCELCMASQDEVDFEGYDFAELTYIINYDDDGRATGALPFYRFYKQIGRSQNGNLTYAVTHVPAVEVTGYREYFEKQKESHRSSDTVAPD